MKNKKSKKLILNTITISKLNRNGLLKIKGGTQFNCTDQSDADGELCPQSELC